MGVFKNEDFHSKTYLKGSILDFTVYEMEDPELPDEGRKLPDIACQYFEKIISTCEDNDIQLILYAAPFGYENGEGVDRYMDRQRISVALEIYLEKRDIPFVYFQKSNKADLDYAADFRDFTHLNFNGAMKITRYLGDFIKENCKSPDHCQESKYRSWLDDYDEFQKDMIKSQKAMQKNNI